MLLAYIVPTKDRPDDLRKMLKSLCEQTQLPHQVVVVDGSSPPIKDVCDEFGELPLDYVRCFPPSLAKQRNAGVAALRPEITVAGYLDDDLVLEPDATERLMRFWAGAGPDVGGAAFSIINQGTVHHDRLLRLFLMHGDPPGRVMRSGFPCYIPFVESTIQTEWLYGGATTWRREVMEKYAYDEWYLGHGFLEDLDYSYRVSREYKLFVLGDARTWHFSAPMARSRQYELGRQQTHNRLYFLRKLEQRSLAAAAWAFFGLFAMNALAAVRHRDRPSAARLAGNAVGLFAGLFGRKESFEGHWKP